MILIITAMFPMWVLLIPIFIHSQVLAACEVGIMASQLKGTITQEKFLQMVCMLLAAACADRMMA